MYLDLYIKLYKETCVFTHLLKYSRLKQVVFHQKNVVLQYDKECVKYVIVWKATTNVSNGLLKYIKVSKMPEMKM